MTGESQMHKMTQSALLEILDFSHWLFFRLYIPQWKHEYIEEEQKLLEIKYKHWSSINNSISELVELVC